MTIARHDPDRIEHVAIVGAGFSGTLQAINLLRHAGPRATLIERRPVPARGVAYSAAHPSHLLNVRAGKMSAFPDDELHFVRWLAEHHPGLDATSFVPRLVYGDYLSGLLDETAERSGSRLTILNGEVVDINFGGDDKPTLLLSDGRRIDADAVVVAVGNLPPHNPAGLHADQLSPSLYARDPWASDLTEGLDPDDSVLLLGTGLTMVDVALLFEARGFAGKLIAVSRRGLLPRTHEGAAPVPQLAERPPTQASALTHAVRNNAGKIGWRSAVDALRPFTQSLWRGASDDEQSRFLRHLRPWWDVHRHRIAPPVAQRIEALRAAGRLDVHAGKLIGTRERDGKAEVTWRPRGADQAHQMRVSRIVNCTGPQGDLMRTSEPLLQRLLERGLIRPDAHRLGLDVDAQCAVVAADGTPSTYLYALGPMTRGCFWEIVAVPDIRVQTWTLARVLSNAHWVEGEGL